MMFRYLAVAALLSVVGAGVLGMRQQQLNDKHAIAELHAQMKNDREQIKDLQVRIAKLTEPEALKDAIRRSELPLVPMTHSMPAKPTPDATTREPSDG